LNRIYLIRHGENLANITKQFSHRIIDYPLTDKGVLQAHQTAAFFRDKGIDEIFSSPLKRAVETAEIIGEVVNRPVTVLENFREINVGDLEGQTPTAELWKQHNDIVAAWLDGQKEICFPGGENQLTLLARTKSGYERILTGKDEKSIIIVGHGGIFTFTLPDLCSGTSRDALTGSMGNCAITELEVEIDNNKINARLVKFASTDHLNGEAARLVPGIPDLSE
jgi:broad specificity phosphatase PhoE